MSGPNEHQSSARGDGWFGLGLFVLVSLLVLMTTARAHIYGDAGVMCRSASSIPDHGWIDVPRSPIVGPDGKFYTFYPLGGVLHCGLGSALQGLGDLIGREQAAPWVGRLFAGILPALEAGWLALGFFLVARRFGFSRMIGGLGALMLIFTSPMWLYARSLYSEIFQSWVILWTLWVYMVAVDTGRRRWFLLGGLMVGLALHAKTTLAILGAATFVYVTMRRIDRSRIIRFLLWGAIGFLPMLVLWVAYNYARFGTFMDTGYSVDRAGTIGFGTPLLAGLHTLLLSPGKSIFVYAPALLLVPLGIKAFWRERRPDLVYVAIPTVFTFLLVAKWWAGHGDWAWGPRLVVNTMPLLFLPLLYAMRRPDRWRWAIAAFAGLGFAVNLLGVLIDHSLYIEAAGVTHAGMQLHIDPLFIRDDLVIVHFVPELSPPVGHYWLLDLYLDGEPWTPSTWYPWKTIGIAGWRPRTDPTPPYLNIWSDGTAGAWMVIGIGYALAASIAVGLFASARRELHRIASRVEAAR